MYNLRYVCVFFVCGVYFNIDMVWFGVLVIWMLCGMIVLKIILLKKLWILVFILCVKLSVVLNIVRRMLLNLSWFGFLFIMLWMILIIWVRFFMVKYLYWMGIIILFEL